MDTRKTSLVLHVEPTISAGERPQTYALDHAATGTDIKKTPINFIHGIQGRPYQTQRDSDRTAQGMYNSACGCYEDVCGTGRTSQCISNSDTAATWK